MTSETAMVAVAALLLSALLTGTVRRLAISHGVIDLPNERSSHVTPTPRGGGLAIVVSTTAALTVLTLLGIVPTDMFVALVGGGTAVAVVGFLDDRRPLSAQLRLAVHFLAALWALWWVGGMPALRFGSHTFALGWAGYLVGAVGIVWTLNLFNFMDGIDGIAATEAVFIGWGGALLALLAGAAAIGAIAFVFGAACCGFLWWNWPTAKIFMGDVGSGYLGYSIAVMAVMAGHYEPAALLAWLILGGVFFIDATVTFTRRLARGERVYEAHRSHAYQWLARRWRSHKRVTVAVLLANVVWLMPLALLAGANPAWAGWVVLLALAPITLAVIAAGGGRSEKP